MLIDYLSVLKPVLLLSIAVVIVGETYKQIAIYYRRVAFRKQNGCEPAQSKAPLKDPFLGIDFVWKTIKNAMNFRYLVGTQERFDKYGNTYVSKHMNFPTIHTIDPVNIKEVLATRFEDYKLSSFRVNAMLPLFGKGIFNVDGAKWSHSRALIRPSFAKHNISMHLNSLEPHVQNFLKAIPSNGTTVDLQKLFFSFTMDTATEFLFGHSVHTLLDEEDGAQAKGVVTDPEFVDAYTTACVETVANIRLGSLQHLNYSAKANRAIKTAHAYVDRFVKEALRLREIEKLSQNSEAAKKENYIFLRELARETGDPQVLREQILSILLAARDTTAALMSNMWFQLARHPEVYAKLRKEVAALDGSLPTANDLRDMKYLKSCINETLRFLPSVPANTREAIRDTVLPHGGGPDGQSPLFVKAGTQVYYSAYAMHRRPEFFGEKADEFRPERWENLRPGWEFLPFNGGPRICIGQQMALTETTYLAARLIQSFEKIEARDARPWTEIYTIVAYSRYGTLVGLTPA